MTRLPGHLTRFSRTELSGGKGKEKDTERMVKGEFTVLASVIGHG